MTLSHLSILCAAAAIACALVANQPAARAQEAPDGEEMHVVVDSLPAELSEMIDALVPPPSEGIDEAIEQLDELLEVPRSATLTEQDYREVAEELGVEVAAIKAVVDIEAGAKHQGFWAPGKPLINFDLTMYRKFAPKHGVNLSKAQKRHPEIFARPNVKRHGSQQAAQQARLDAAIDIDEESALESTFWGMFQIGGFNWKKCGTRNIEEFVSLMSRSERDQLELFAAFVKNSGMLPFIQKKQWDKFALRYNGPNYRSRNYHGRLAQAYAKHKKSR